MILTLYDTEGSEYTFGQVLHFVYRKEKYLPYTELHVTLCDPEQQVPFSATIRQVRMVLDGQVLHNGLTDRVTLQRKNGVTLFTIASKGYTSLLQSNELTPGLHTRMSLDRMMTAYYTFPSCITWQSVGNASNYIYVKQHHSMWDGVINLGYKIYGKHPYIKGHNEIRLSAHDNPKRYVVTADEMLTAENGTVGNRMISHLHMQDLDGNYDVYNLENPDAQLLQVVRHKKIAFDRQYLNNPEQSMQLTLALSEQGWRWHGVTCRGYPHVDLYDCIGAEGIFDAGTIAAVTVQGDAKGICSQFAIYDDGFA